MPGQPADENPGQNNMNGGGQGNYYNNQMQGSAASNPSATDGGTYSVTPFAQDYTSHGRDAPAFFAPGLNGTPGGGSSMLFQNPQGSMFGNTQGMMDQAYDPAMIQGQRDLMLQNARQANLMGLQGAQAQMSQMGLGSLGGQAGLMSGQYAQGAMGEAQAQQSGQQMADMAAQGAISAQGSMLQMERQVGDAIAQAYGSAYDVVTQTAPNGYKINEALEADLAEYSNMVGQSVFSGEMSQQEAQMLLSTYADRWSQQTGLSKYRRHDMGPLRSPSAAYKGNESKTGTTQFDKEYKAEY